MTIETFIRERTNYGALWDTFNAAMNATLGFDSTQVSMLFMLAYANGKLSCGFSIATNTALRYNSNTSPKVIALKCP